MPARPSVTPSIDVVGLGPSGPELITAETLELLGGAAVVVLRTGRHPSAAVAPAARTFDHHYERAETFEGVYRAMADDLVAEAERSGSVVYAVPGSPTVAEDSVARVTDHAAVRAGVVTVRVHPAVSFIDVACARLGIDPVASGLRLVDGESFAVDAAGERGPLLVAQCWSAAVLSDIKLSVEATDLPAVTVLWHLGLDDERVWEVAWEDLDRSFAPDHLTSLWIPRLEAPVAAELMKLDELVHTLRQRCPWDREQTHRSLARHLLEESYEVLEAIDAVAAVDAAGPGGNEWGDGGPVPSRPVPSGPVPSGPVPSDRGPSDRGPRDRGPSDPDRLGRVAEHPAPDPGPEEDAVAHLEEELGDLLFQVYFHALLAAEAGRFTLADVARGVHDKLVSRHPHVFGDVEADTPGEVAANWEARKLAEKNRQSVTEGIPAALPALALAAKLQRKALAVGMVLPGVADEAARVAEGVAGLVEADTGEAPHRDVDGEGGRADRALEVGDLLFSLVNVARVLGVDPETALRARDAAFRRSVEAIG